MRAQKTGKRAAKCGMDFSSAQAAAEKLSEEQAELFAAIAAGDKQAVFDEAGDLLFSAVNVCRLAGADCEEALRASTEKFAKRFSAFESLALADGKDLTKMSEDEMNAYWEKAKNALKNC